MELQDLLNLVKECKGSGAWTSSSLIRVGGVLASKINTIQNLSGTEKLKLVQRVLLQALAEAENTEIAEPNLSKDEIQKIHDRYDSLEQTVADVLPVSLELAIKAARGGLDLRKIKPSMWVRLCSCFATTAVHQLASLNMISETHATQARQALLVLRVKAEEAAEKKEKEESQKPSEESQPAEEKKESAASSAEPVAKDTA